jgi:hypothetical protein
VRDVVKNITGFADEHSRVIAATIDSPAGELRVVNGYFVNGQAPGSEKFDYKMSWLRGLRDYLREELAHHPRLVLLGDFNIAPEDRDSFDPVGLRVAEFSNTGAIVSGPGVDIVSAALDHGLEAMSGTSMAAPHVAGVAALWGEKALASGTPWGVGVRDRLPGQASTDALAPGFDPVAVGAGLVHAPQR